MVRQRQVRLRVRLHDAHHRALLRGVFQPRHGLRPQLPLCAAPAPLRYAQGAGEEYSHCWKEWIYQLCPRGNLCTQFAFTKFSESRPEHFVLNAVIWAQVVEGFRIKAQSGYGCGSRAKKPASHRQPLSTESFVRARAKLSSMRPLGILRRPIGFAPSSNRHSIDGGPTKT